MDHIYNTALTQATAIIRHNLKQFTHHFQSSNSHHLFYETSDNVEWTTGFCTGQYWLAYECTHDTSFKDAALIQVGSFEHRIQNNIDVEHHDMGFLYTPSCVAAWKLCQSDTGKKAALLAADKLMSRFHEKGQFFRA